MIKRLLFIMSILVFMVSSVNAVEYLNSCGKNSGWVNGETYILNFTEIPSVYAPDYCFRFTSEVDDITFEGQNKKIINQNDLLDLDFIDIRNSDSNLDNWELNNIHIDKIRRFMWVEDTNSGSSTQVVDIDMNNITIDNLFSFLRTQEDSTTANARIIRGNFDNIIIKNVEGRFMYARRSSNTNTKIGDINFTNSYVNTFEFADEFGSGLISDNYFNNFVTTAQIGFLSSNGNIYNNSLLTFYNNSDSNNDGIGDTLFNVWSPNPRVWVETQEYNFFQDVEEGRGDGNFNFVNDNSKPYIFLSTNESFVSPHFIAPQTTMSFPLANDFTSRNMFGTQNIFTLGSGASIDCSILNYLDKCFFNDLGGSQTTGDEFRGFVLQQSNTGIFNTYMFKTNTNPSDNQMFSTITTQQNDIEIQNNTFSKEDGKAGTFNPFAKLFVTNLDFSNNNVEMYTLNDPANIYHFMEIQSTNGKKNNIYNNTFQDLGGTAPANPHKVFSLNCDTNFYNNYVGSNVDVLNYGCGTEFNVTPLVPYEHTDGKVYYFEVGNYYEDNTGCTDSDVDGRCDSPYVGSEYTDTQPLSSYPFEYQNNLLFAEQVVDNTSYEVTLLNPQDEQNFTLSSTGDIISLSFSHNSEFPDLQCDYILDGSLVDSETNTQSATTYSTDITGWENKSYTYRVECYNSINFQSSNEITFNVVVDSSTNGGGDNGNGGTDNGTGSTGSFFNPSNLFGGDVTQTTSEVNNLFSFFSSFYSMLYVIGAILLFFAILMLIVALINTPWRK